MKCTLKTILWAAPTLISCFGRNDGFQSYHNCPPQKCPLEVGNSEYAIHQNCLNQSQTKMPSDSVWKIDTRWQFVSTFSNKNYYDDDCDYSDDYNYDDGDDDDDEWFCRETCTETGRKLCKSWSGAVFFQNRPILKRSPFFKLFNIEEWMNEPLTKEEFQYSTAKMQNVANLSVKKFGGF